jgi:hypothetical protein
MINGASILADCQGALTPPCVKANVVEQDAVITMKLPLVQ